MTRVGVRGLRQRASELLRRVAGGETIEVADRARPVALLVPLPSGTPFERLRAAGEVQPATADLDDLPEPVAMAMEAGQELPSAVLGHLRADDR